MIKNDLKLICIPGFLGLPEDFKCLKKLNLDMEVLDILGSDGLKPGQDWKAWETAMVAKLNVAESQGFILLGYSMGARLALSMLQSQPRSCKAAILLSCHPGLASEQEKSERRISDLDWAKRFLSEPWEPLIDSWNQQETLRNTRQSSWKEEQFDRKSLARALSTFSLSNQNRAGNLSIDLPTLICWGNRDLKFGGLARILSTSFKRYSSIEIPDSGHRILLDNPEYLIERINEFLASL